MVRKVEKVTRRRMMRGWGRGRDRGGGGLTRDVMEGGNVGRRLDVISQIDVCILLRHTSGFDTCLSSWKLL